MEQAGVYKIQCGDCPGFYIGQTGRSIQQRLQEHLDAHTKEDKNKFAVARHLLENKHNLEKISIKLVHRERKSAQLNKLEEYEVVKAS